MNNMSNSSYNETLTWNDVKVQWMTSLIFSSLSSVGVLYLIIAMMVHLIKQAKRCTDIFKRKWIDLVIVSAAVAILLYVVLELPLITRQHEPYCTIYEKTKVVCFGFSLMCIYSVLWLRMLKAFYLKPATGENLGKSLRFFSQVTFALLVAMTVIDTSIFLTASPYRTTALGCVKSTKSSRSVAKWIALIVTTTLCQGCLLFYFIYPLYVHRKRMGRHGIHSKSVLPLIKRLVAVLMMCIAANIVGYTFIAIYKSPTVYVTNIVLGSNLVFHLVALVYLFQDWKQRLNPFSIIASRRNATWVISTEASVQSPLSKSKHRQTIA
uniref:uncharacterized protein LOC113474971 n=1 Tax=Ciona intestinalis TaxID=7719 RepID=UPI000180BA5E|nr:uncharacterized protein LOC113474971 [Ciona intestinalis]|eukprot:XP_026693954.1 uncharacterized protein LOC113474971 [Ciona intestinalis]